MNVTLQWATPDADKHIMFMARVSNPTNQTNENTRLLHYCMEEGHVSPFEMASVCIGIDTTRDIARQILRHRSFSFQEFSQRYADVGKLPEAELRECRLQDTKNRQNSIDCEEGALAEWWEIAQSRITNESNRLYKEALANGIAKEQARALLPEGLTASRLYMNGTIRSWIHYLKQRLHPSTQKEHRLIAQQVLEVLRTVAPITMLAFFPSKEIVMNERIRELVRRAGFAPWVTDATADVVLTRELAKFAELIIQECITKIEAHQIPVGNSAAAIKHYFGMAE